MTKKKQKPQNNKSPIHETQEGGWTHDVVEHREIPEPNASLYPVQHAIRIKYEQRYSYSDILQHVRNALTERFQEE